MSAQDLNHAVERAAPVGVVAHDPRDAFFMREHLHEDLRRRSVRGGAITAISQGLRFALRLGSIPVLARLLTPEDFGVMNVVTGLTMFVGLLGFSGLPLAIVQRDTITHRQVSALFWLNALASVVMALLTLAAAPLVGWFFNDPRTGWVTAALAVTVFLGGMVVQHQAILQRQMRLKVLSGVDLLAQVISIVIGVAAAFAASRWKPEWGYWALVVQTLVYQALYAGAIWWATGWAPSRVFKAEGVRTMLFFGLDLTFFNIVGTIKGQIDLQTIGRMFGVEAAGYYSRSFNVLQLPIAQLVQPLAGVALPMLSLLKNDEPRFRSSWCQLQDKIAIATMPAITGLFATSDWSIRVLLGPNWGPTARIFETLGPLGLVHPIMTAHYWIFIAFDRTRVLLYAAIIQTVIIAVGVGVGVRWGVTGVAWGMVASTVLAQVPFQFWYTARHTPVTMSDIARSLSPALAFSAAVYACCWGIRRGLHLDSQSLGQSALGLALAIIASLVGCAMLYACVPALRSTVHQYLDLISSVLRRAKPKPSPQTPSRD